jgi:transcriptional regulator with XRE-family HTH domain
MAGKEPNTGPTAMTVVANVKRLRTDQNLSYTELSHRLDEVAGWSVNPVGVRRIEDGERRVTVDDLFALAAALGVSPTTLLIPNADDGGEQVAATGVTEKCDAERLWKWLRIEEPIDPDDMETLEFRMVALPAWKKRQMMANVKYVNVDFSSEGGLAKGGEAQ